MSDDGWQLVPKILTREMLQAATDSWNGDQGPKAYVIHGSEIGDMYRAMLASAPAPSPDNGWLPIESAPRTEYGTGPRLLLWDGFSVFEGFKNGPLYVTAETCSQRPHVTHYRPIPPPPAQGGGK